MRDPDDGSGDVRRLALLWALVIGAFAVAALWVAGCAFGVADRSHVWGLALGPGRLEICDTAHPREQDGVDVTADDECVRVQGWR